MKKYRQPYYSVGVRRWTETAKMCYLRGCICESADCTPSICEYKVILGKECRMKATVIELVRKFGIPKGVSERTVLNENDSKRS